MVYVCVNIGFGRAARVGSCALVCVVHNNKVYCGNVGDSLGLIVRSDSPMGFQ
jgi:serine/threonine protein phosphatase PrpC